MGVEFYHCTCCNESKYEEYVGWCTECGKGICTSCVTNDDVDSPYASCYGEVYDGSNEQKERLGIIEEEIEKGYFELGEVIDDTSIAPKYCPYCQGEKFNEDKFVQWLYQKLGKTRDELIKEYKENANK